MPEEILGLGAAQAQGQSAHRVTGMRERVIHRDEDYHGMLNGKGGEWARWALGLVCVALVSMGGSYFAMSNRVVAAEIEIKALQGQVASLSEDVRELRADVKMILQAVR
jgi:hypothetical protein